MIKNSFVLAFRMWFLSNLILSVLILGYLMIMAGAEAAFALLILVGGLVVSSPVIVVLGLAGRQLELLDLDRRDKIQRYFGLCLLITMLFGIAILAIVGVTGSFPHFQSESFLAFAGLVISVLMAGIFSHVQMHRLFSSSSISTSMFNTDYMETESTSQSARPGSSRILAKGLLTGGLILVMLVPTIFILNLVSERQARQQEVAKEVSSKWSSAQTVTGPFLYLPYSYPVKDSKGNIDQVESHFWVLPDELQVNGTLDHQLRQRSIYKVLLYRADLKQSGQFLLQIPKDVLPDQVKWQDAKICIGISDFKGIESRVVVQTDSIKTELSPGLPFDEVAKFGLSAPAGLNAADIGKTIPFSAVVNIKGSESLHFIPLGGNSSFSLRSKWTAPSFDGNNLPSDRVVNDSGFSAKWTFNKANLPFGTILKDTKFDMETLAFGVTMVQPADQYAKTERAVKYAILIIGLTFSLFFIVELMQRKPVHPVQYVLIGLALVIFYTLLLSISEFIVFDTAYIIAAVATVSLITMYVKAHFRNWKAAGIFSTVLSLLYIFIFVLVRLEDTALLIGSIGLFLILAIAMYFSRKIDWYGEGKLAVG
jgi:inner membrane protein